MQQRHGVYHHNTILQPVWNMAKDGLQIIILNKSDK